MRCKSAGSGILPSSFAPDHRASTVEQRSRTWGPYAEYAEDILKPDDSFRRLIDGTLDISPLESGCMPINAGSFDTQATVNPYMTLIRPAAEKASLRLTGLYEAQCVAFSGDERTMTQLILNLLSNAIKFTPAYGETTARIFYDTARRLSVTDTGNDIAADGHRESRLQ